VVIVWKVRAIRDRDAIHAYIARDNPARAYEVVLAITKAVNLLADFPQLGRLGRKAGTQDLVVPRLPYIVPYRRRSDRIEIIRILHTSRNLA